MGLKKWLINFGLKTIVKNAFNQLVKNKPAVIRFMEDEAIKFINSIGVNGLVKIGIDQEDAQLLKDKGVLLVRAIILVLVNLLINKAEDLSDKLVAKVKL